MITNGSDYKLLKDLSLLDLPISRSDNLALLRKDIQANIRRAYDRNVRQYNLRAKLTSFREAQEVYRRNFAQSKFVQNYNANLGPQFVKLEIVITNLKTCKEKRYELIMPRTFEANSR